MGPKTSKHVFPSAIEIYISSANNHRLPSLTYLLTRLTFSMDQNTTLYSQPSPIAGTVLEAIILHAARINRISHTRVFIEEIGKEEGANRDIYKLAVYQSSSRFSNNRIAQLQPPIAVIACAVDVSPPSHVFDYSNSLDEYNMLVKLSSKTDILPKPIALISLQDGRHIAIKEYLWGKTIKYLQSDVPDKTIKYLAFLAGQMFGRFFLETGGMPLDAHPGNVIVDFNVSPVTARLCDSRGYYPIENPASIFDPAYPKLQQISSRYFYTESFFNGIILGSEGCHDFHKNIRKLAMLA